MLHTRTTRLLIVPLLVAIALLAACGPGDAKASVTSTGTGPKTLLRFAPEPGLTQRSTLRMSIDIEQTYPDGSTQRIPTPTIEIDYTTLVQEVRDNGDIVSQFSFTDARVVKDGRTDAAVRAAVRAELAMMIGAKGRGVTTPSGEVVEIVFDERSDLSKQARAMLASIEDEMSSSIVVLPDEPMGVGGSWTTEQTLEIGGIKQDITIEYTITSLQGTIVEIALKTTTRAGSQTVNNPDLPEGVSVKLKDQRGSGKGTMTIDLRSPETIALQLDESTTQRMTISAQGERVSISQVVKGSTSVRTAKANP